VVAGKMQLPIDEHAARLVSKHAAVAFVVMFQAVDPVE
jgi:hypothetical protein